MNRMKRLLAAALTFAATLSLASCGTSNSEDSVGQTPAPPSQTAESQSAGRELSMALSVDPDGLDPQRTTAASTFQITNNLYDTLLRVNTDGSLREGLAQKWEVSEDGLTLTFHLRPDVRFHNLIPASEGRGKPPRCGLCQLYVFCSGCGYCGSNL